MKKLIFLSVVFMFMGSALMAKEATSAENLPLLFDNHFHKSKMDLDHILKEWHEDIQEEQVLDHQVVQIDQQSLFADKFMVNLHDGERFTISKQDMDFLLARKKFEYVNYEKNILMSLFVTDNGIVGDIHVGELTYVVRPLSDGLHSVVVTSFESEAYQGDEQPHVDTLDIETKVSHKGHWIRADFYNKGKDGVGRSRWDGNKLVIDFDFNLNGTWDYTKTFSCHWKGAYGTPDGWVVGDWDNDGRDGIAFYWRNNVNGPVSTIEIRRDGNTTGPANARPHVTGHYDFYLAGDFPGTGSCSSGESLAFVNRLSNKNFRVSQTCNINAFYVSSINPFHPYIVKQYTSDFPGGYTPVAIHAANVNDIGAPEFVAESNSTVRSYKIGNINSNPINNWTWTAFWYRLFMGDWYGSPNGKEAEALQNTDPGYEGHWSFYSDHNVYLKSVVFP